MASRSCVALVVVGGLLLITALSLLAVPSSNVDPAHEIAGEVQEGCVAIEPGLMCSEYVTYGVSPSLNQQQADSQALSMTAINLQGCPYLVTDSWACHKAFPSCVATVDEQGNAGITEKRICRYSCWAARRADGLCAAYSDTYIESECLQEFYADPHQGCYAMSLDDAEANDWRQTVLLVCMGVLLLVVCGRYRAFYNAYRDSRRQRQHENHVAAGVNPAHVQGGVRHVIDSHGAVITVPAGAGQELTTQAPNGLERVPLDIDVKQNNRSSSLRDVELEDLHSTSADLDDDDAHVRRGDGRKVGAYSQLESDMNAEDLIDSDEA